ncbi:MAG: 4Fe-4S binding protein [Armatimonadetes bacterium]|nr:4Fe-4S binding protein [Armatimonadota bacterium]MDE2206430.1 4Fe-4S binding protein [Armatimonadota bacterium]
MAAGGERIPLRVIQPEPPQQTPGRVDLFLKFPFLGRLFKMRNFPMMLIIPNLIMFWIFLLAGVFGTPVGSHNIIIVFIWILWWFALIAVLMPFGSRLWCTMCPLPFFGDWVQRRALTYVRSGNSAGTRNKLFGKLKVWPKPLCNIWVQNIGFLMLASFSAHLVTRPMATVIMLGSLIVIAGVMGLVYRQRVFCNYVCPVSGFLSLYSMTSMVELRARKRETCLKCTSKACVAGSDKGWACPWIIYMGRLERNNYCGMCTECVKSCPNDNIALFWRPFCSDKAIKGYDELWKAFIMLVLAMAYSVVLLGPWGKIKSWANVAEVGNWRGFATYVSILWFSSLVALPAIYYVAIGLGRKLAVASAKAREGTPAPSMKDLFIKYGYTLVPLGLMAWIAFSFPLIMVSGAYIIAVISDPMGWGWNLFGTAHVAWAPFHPAWMPYIQIPCLMLGLYYALIRGREIADTMWTNRRAAVLSLAPLAVLLTAITMVFLKLYTG